mmetsp:Transcript_16258/g.38406  ORF Transcript_16258/g.38406 Transcript_16258/m.38406 type:complete len:231 (+) Transcript_16258:34-726(+)
MARRLVFLAELAEQTARFEDMAMLMQTVAEEQHWLSSTERCLLSAAFKQLIGPRRAAVRLVDNPQVLRCEHAVFGAYLAEYRQQLVQDLEDWIHKLLTLLDDILIPSANDCESLVFYLKMKADYHRHMAPIGQTDDTRQLSRETARQTYLEAEHLAARLPVTHPVRLGLALNHAVFFHELMTDAEAGRRKARKAFESALLELDGIPEDNYKEATLIMQLLRDAAQGPIWE